MALAVLSQPYPARVKDQFWFRELRQAVALLADGKSFADIKKLSEEEKKNKSEKNHFYYIFY